MNQEQLVGAVRLILMATLPTLVTWGLITQTQVTDLTSGAIAIIMLGWSVYDHRHAAKVKAGLDALVASQDVKKIVTVPFPTDPLIAAAVADPGQPKITPVDPGSVIKVPDAGVGGTTQANKPS